MLLFWSLEFWGGSYTFRTIVDTVIFADDVNRGPHEITLHQGYTNPVHLVAWATNFIRWHLTFLGPWYRTSPFYPSDALNYEVALRSRKIRALLL